MLQLCPPNAKGIFVSLQAGIRSIGRTAGPATFVFLALINPLFLNLTSIYWTLAIIAAIIGIVVLLLPKSRLKPSDHELHYVEQSEPMKDESSFYSKKSMECVKKK